MAKGPLSLEELLHDTNQKYKHDIISRGVPQMEEIPRIPFTVPELNRMTYGGIPVGRIVEFFGEEGGGKTTTALDVIANAQKNFPDKEVVFIDVEHTFDTIWASKMGVDCSKLIMVDPDIQQTAGDILELALGLIESGQVCLIVLDSIANLVSAQELEKDVDEKTYGGIARELGIFGRKAAPLCKAKDCTFIGINQIREEMNSQYIQYRTPGGKGWKHACSFRIEFRRSTFLDQDGKETTNNCMNPSGHYIRARLDKNKVCPNDHRIVTYTLKYLTGLDVISDTIESAIQLGILEKGGAWISWPAERPTEDKGVYRWNGRAKLWDALHEDKKLFEDLLHVVNQRILSV